MLIAKTFYRGFPPDGVTAGASDGNGERVTKVDVFKLNVQVPGWKRWRVTSIRAINASTITAYYSVAFLRIGLDGVGNPPQGEIGKLTYAAAPPHSSNVVPTSPVAGYPLLPTWNYLAYAEPIPPSDSVEKKVVGSGSADEFLCVGAYPGQILGQGFGAVHLEIAGWEIRD